MVVTEYFDETLRPILLTFLQQITRRKLGRNLRVSIQKSRNEVATYCLKYRTHSHDEECDMGMVVNLILP